MAQELRTTSLAEAAYLHSVGYHDFWFEMIGADRVQWNFRSCDGIADAQREFQEGRATVEPMAFMQALTLARKRMFGFLNDH